MAEGRFVVRARTNFVFRATRTDKELGPGSGTLQIGFIGTETLQGKRVAGGVREFDIRDPEKRM